MVLPLVPLAIAVGSVITAGGGVILATVGGRQIRAAGRQIRLHTARYEKCHATHLANVEQANEALKAFGRSQDLALREVIFRMRDFLERHAKQVRAHEHLILDGVDGSDTQVVGMAKLDPDVVGWVRGVVGSAVAGAATPVAFRAAVMKLAKASTGTAISSLSGAAAEKATHAFLGGGSLVKGGGGVKLGTTMLNVATAGPAILIAGITVKNQGTKSRTEADTHRAEVDVAIALLEMRDEVLRGVRKRAGELDEILIRLASQATAALDILESEPFNVDVHAERLQTALILVKSVRDVATAPVADENGNLEENTEQLIFKYRDANMEGSNA